VTAYFENLEAPEVTDSKQIKEKGIDLLTCTPVLGGRKLGDQVPESPFLKSTSPFQGKATPLLTGMKIKENGDTN